MSTMAGRRLKQSLRSRSGQGAHERLAEVAQPVRRRCIHAWSIGKMPATGSPRRRDGRDGTAPAAGCRAGLPASPRTFPRPE